MVLYVLNLKLKSKQLFKIYNVCVKYLHKYVLCIYHYSFVPDKTRSLRVVLQKRNGNTQYSIIIHKPNNTMAFIQLRWHVRDTQVLVYIIIVINMYARFVTAVGNDSKTDFHRV